MSSDSGIEPCWPPAVHADGRPHAGRAARGRDRIVPGRPRASELEARSDMLVTAAAALFRKQGYGATSLHAIAREARVAVRTIYVKFGGKAGLLRAVIERSHQGYRSLLLECTSSQQPLARIVDDFSERFLQLVLSPDAVALQRTVIAEAQSHPELAHTFYQCGLALTRTLLAEFFSRPEIRSQLRQDAVPHLLPVHLINCIVGDHFQRFLAHPEQLRQAGDRQALEQRLAFFYRAALIDFTEPSPGRLARGDGDNCGQK